jgi:hypothetical protein
VQEGGRNKGVAALINKSQGSGEGQAQAKARQQKNCDGRGRPGRILPKTLSRMRNRPMSCRAEPNLVSSTFTRMIEDK